MCGPRERRGVYSITLTVADANGVTAINTFPLSVSVLLEIDTLPTGTIETAYSKALRVIGGTAAYTASQIGGQLPLGLALDAGGAVSGTPHENGDFNLVARFTDSTGRTLQV